MAKKKAPKKEKPSAFVPPKEVPAVRYVERLFHITYEYPLRGCYSIDVKSTIPNLGPTEASLRLRGYDAVHKDFEVPALLYTPEDAVTFVVGMATQGSDSKGNSFEVVGVRHWNRTVLHKLFDFVGKIFD